MAGAASFHCKPELEPTMLAEHHSHYVSGHPRGTPLQICLFLPSWLDKMAMHPSFPYQVCGDVHGQFYDLLNVWEMNGLPSLDNPYLFNGDFVDRGSFSVEVILSLLAFKCLMPDAMFMSRGNHESKNMNKVGWDL